MRSLRINLDALGMCASTLCMVHCLAFPLLLPVLPLLKLSATPPDHSTQVANVDVNTASPASPADPCCEQECCQVATSDVEKDAQPAACCSTPTDFWIHVGLLTAIAPLGFVAWGLGYRRHGQSGALALGLTGVLMLCAALLFGRDLLQGRGEQVMTVLGSVCMVSAHLWNRRQCQCCRSPSLATVVEAKDSVLDLSA